MGCSVVWCGAVGCSGVRFECVWRGLALLCGIAVESLGCVCIHTCT